MDPTDTLDFNAFKVLCESLSGNAVRQLSKTKPVYVFGAGSFGRDVAKALKNSNFNLLGFIETNPRQKYIDNLPIFCWSDIPRTDLSAQLLVGIFNRDVPFDELKAYALKAGFNDIFMPWDIYNLFSGQLGWRYWLSKKDVLLGNVSSLQETYDLLSDDESKRTLLNICQFRLGLNDPYSSFKHQEKQYFNELTLASFTGLKCDYIDCGAYNGDTFLDASFCLDLNEAYLFEPDPVNFLELVRVVNSTKLRATCLPMAVSDRYQILSFSGAGEGGAISENGEAHIAAVSLDQMLPKSTVDFIKFDVEGAEVLALTGAQELIKRSRPVLVLSLYHRPNDLWEIPSLVARYCPNYKFYLRQHFNNSFDSVFYAVPQ